MRALAFILAFLAILFVLRHAGEKPQLLVDAVFPTQNGPLLLPPQLCPAPWAVCVGEQCAKRKVTV